MIPVLPQRAASEGAVGQLGDSPAPGARTIRMCSLDGRNRNLPTAPRLRETRIGTKAGPRWTAAIGIIRAALRDEVVLRPSWTAISSGLETVDHDGYPSPVRLL